jgi:hypothetical protein
MKKFEDRINGGVSITDNQAQVNLTPNEAYTLWQWLSERKDAFQAQSRETPLELQIHLHQEDLGHLDELKAAIPDLHEHGSIVKVFDAPLGTVSEQALQLLQKFQIEYHIHPFLEDDDIYAQG